MQVKEVSWSPSDELLAPGDFLPASLRSPWEAGSSGHPRGPPGAQNRPSQPLRAPLCGSFHQTAGRGPRLAPEQGRGPSCLCPEGKGTPARQGSLLGGNGSPRRFPWGTVCVTQHARAVPSGLVLITRDTHSPHSSPESCDPTASWANLQLLLLRKP